MRETGDAMGEVHDDAHIVLDDEERHAELGIGAAEPVDKAVDERRVDAGRRFVEKQELRLVHQRHGEFEKLLLAEAETARPLGALLVKAYKGREDRRRAASSRPARDGAARQGRHVLRAR